MALVRLVDLDLLITMHLPQQSADIDKVLTYPTPKDTIRAIAVRWFY
jgi:hypothetical protein